MAVQQEKKNTSVLPLVCSARVLEAPWGTDLAADGFRTQERYPSITFPYRVVEPGLQSSKDFGQDFIFTHFPL